MKKVKLKEYLDSLRHMSTSAYVYLKFCVILATIPIFAALCIVAVVAARVVFPKEVKEELHEELEELKEHGHHEEPGKDKEA